jgi:hypothetical protein
VILSQIHKNRLHFGPECFTVWVLVLFYGEALKSTDLIFDNLFRRFLLWLPEISAKERNQKKSKEIKRNLKKKRRKEKKKEKERMEGKVPGNRENAHRDPKVVFSGKKIK